MVVGSSRQETLNSGFVLLGTCQRGEQKSNASHDKITEPLNWYCSEQQQKWEQSNVIEHEITEHVNKI
ncbi:unnamed protein product [Schistosoma margrebowiei]|uniref:Uncharacterized protein n=1 Tax=Schistosoma margrebowiei TaxID=48269 RepID=A0A183LCD0_9TREM|nr:unnamed protein product [Schistosoma margrebowiei]